MHVAAMPVRRDQTVPHTESERLSVHMRTVPASHCQTYHTVWGRTGQVRDGAEILSEISVEREREREREREKYELKFKIPAEFETSANCLMLKMRA